MLQRLNLPEHLDGNAWFYASPAAGNRRHRHAELELNLVVHGCGTYLLGSRRYEIQRGDLLWLFPGQEHVLFEQTQDFKMWVVVFKRRVIRRSAKDAATRMLLQRSPQGDACRRLRAQDFSRCNELFAELSKSIEQPALLNAGLGYALLDAWKCFGQAADVPAEEMHPAVQRAAWLIRNDASNANLNDLARQVGLSASRLSRLFKMQMGICMVDFRNQQRIERFLQLYGHGENCTLITAALEAGFGSYPQFHRVFKAIMGYSPAEQKWSGSQ